MTGQQPASRLVLYTRRDCPLCEEMLAELAGWMGKRPLPLAVVDVDADPETRRRFGLLVPVLVLDGRPVLNGRFDPDVAEELLGE